MRDDSRRVCSGDIFVAIRGERNRGDDFIADAVRRGAAAIVYESGMEALVKAPLIAIEVEDSRLALSELCAFCYSPQPAHLLGVTGTSGKSSVVEFGRQILDLLGIGGASLGTLGVQCSRPSYQAISVSRDRENALTSMPAVPLHRELQKLARSGVEYALLEASSHGLLQKRLHGLRFGAAGFTNLSRDHLDYHASMADYFASKCILFEELLTTDGVIISNADSDRHAALRALAERAGKRFFGYGKKGDEICLRDCTATERGIAMRVDFFGKIYDVEVALIGEFQAANILLTSGLLHVCGIGADLIWQVIPQLQGVSGRMQEVLMGGGSRIIVDYAHKPEALRSVLSVLRIYTRGKLIVVFGCGGDRDSGKREQMGRIASALADFSIITDDNPRHESASLIRSEVMGGFTDAGSYIEIGDRRLAIKYGLELLGERDGSVLLVAGKGHESGQIIGDDVLEFDDVAVIGSLLGGVDNGVACG